MCKYCEEVTVASAPFARRNVLKFAGAAAAALALSSAALAKENKMAPPPKPQNVLSPDAALDRLMNGNRAPIKFAKEIHRSALCDVEQMRCDGSSAADAVFTMPLKRSSVTAR